MAHGAFRPASRVYEIPAKVAEERRTVREPEIPDKGVKVDMHATGLASIFSESIVCAFAWRMTFDVPPEGFAP